MGNKVVKLDKCLIHGVSETSKRQTGVKGRKWKDDQIKLQSGEWAKENLLYGTGAKGRLTVRWARIGQKPLKKMSAFFKNKETGNSARRALQMNYRKETNAVCRDNGESGKDNVQTRNLASLWEPPGWTMHSHGGWPPQNRQPAKTDSVACGDSHLLR